MQTKKPDTDSVPKTALYVRDWTMKEPTLKTPSWKTVSLILALIISCAWLAFELNFSIGNEQFLSSKLVESAKSTNIVIRPHYRGTIQVGTNFYTRTVENKLEIKP